MVTEPTGNGWYADALRELIAELTGHNDAANAQQINAQDVNELRPRSRPLPRGGAARGSTAYRHLRLVRSF